VPNSIRTVTFAGGKQSFTIPPAALAVSDPLTFPVAARDVLTVSIHLARGQQGAAITSHPGSRTTSYFAAGNRVADADLSDTGVQKADHWYFISSVSGFLPQQARAVAILGDSLTDGRGSTTNGNNRWPDVLQDRLLGVAFASSPGGVAVLNQAAGGNRVLADGLGPSALSRLERDVLSHAGVAYAMVYHGVNDIGTAAVDAAAQAAVGDRLIAGLDQIITRLHALRVAVVGCTLTPFSGEGQTYSSAERDATRRRVNAWIRGGARFDAVVDFDAAVSDPRNRSILRTEFDTGDHLHMNPAGYVALANAVDLTFFEDFAGGVDLLT
jgi:lysophospholipase L1-like esterase